MTIARRTFRSLAIRNYRLFFVGQGLSQIGTWMQTVAQGWLVLHLSHDSGIAVGVVTALMFLPMLLLGPLGGVIADRVDKRKALVVTAAAQATIAAVLATLTLSGVVELWMVYAIAFTYGCVTVVDMPTRQAFVTEMVGPDDLPNAIGLNSALFNGARTLGPAVAGAVIVVAGTGWCFLLNSVSYVAVIGALLAMRRDELFAGTPVRRARGQIREGFAYVWRTPVLRSTILLITVVSTFGFNFSIVLPVLAKVTFHRSAATYGLLSSSLGAGSLVGALVAAGRSRPTPRLLVGAAAAFGVMTMVAATAPTVTSAAVLLFVVGATSISFMATANATVQLNSTATMRGRVMSLYGVVFLGSTPIGGPIAGWVSQHFGARAGIGMGGALSLVGALVAASALYRARNRQPGEVVPDTSLAAA